MEARSKSSLVSKVAITLFLVSNVSWGQSLVVSWQQEITRDCEDLIHVYLEELRSVAPDISISAEIVDHVQAGELGQHLHLDCIGKNTLRVAADVEYLFRFNVRAKSYDATDWIAFQQNYLGKIDLTPPSINLSDLAPKYSAIEKNQPLATAELVSDSILKKWWFWSLVAASGGGAYWFLKSRSHPNKAIIQVR